MLQHIYWLYSNEALVSNLEGDSVNLHELLGQQKHVVPPTKHVGVKLWSLMQQNSLRLLVIEKKSEELEHCGEANLEKKLVNSQLWGEPAQRFLPSDTVSRMGTFSQSFLVDNVKQILVLTKIERFRKPWKE